ncbi:MaoC family dehydratase N-terminal domain-containing protein [Tomitella cavernea]|uniref:MaoC family dehydratase N-terminal domain-containing protein n=1 Tax=Tomitella cavernea TaxID=1387982 RepID=A0ABP9CUT7_9ACTN|nr:MaoC family dehydratase N-terminal domain-containing protein [Tomitella cavernea]
MTDGTPPAVFTEIAEHWRPDPAVAEEVLAPWPAAALAALLGADPPAEDTGALPPLWHEVYLRDRPRIADLGEDGHPLGGPLLPPIPRRRRMFGGGRIVVHEPLGIGDRVRRTSAVRSVRVRHGRSGWLLLVTERHAFEADGRQRVEDERDIVYRMPGDIRGTGASAAAVRVGVGDASAAGTSSTGSAPAPIVRLDADERLLMLTSALTYNPHRIHYDRDYATRVEGHPGLVVHGPLLALEGVEAARRVGGRYPDRVDYRLTATAYPGTPVDFVEPAGGPGDGPIRAEPGSVRIEGRQGGRLCIRVDAAWEGAAAAGAGAVSPPR